jgi:hypothetical protein
MEDLFAPTITRYRDLYYALVERDDDDDNLWGTEEQIDGLVELELITGSSAEDTFLHSGFTWSDFYAWARGKMVWILGPDVFFDLSWIRPGFQTDYRSFLEVTTVPNDEDDTSQESKLRVYASSEAHATVAADILIQCLTTGDFRKVELENDGDADRYPVSGLAFSHFLSQSRNLRVLRLTLLDLNTCHFRAIDALARTDLRIELFSCVPTESGEEILLECIRQNRLTHVVSPAPCEVTTASTLSPHVNPAAMKTSLF